MLSNVRTTTVHLYFYKEEEMMRYDWNRSVRRLLIVLVNVVLLIMLTAFCCNPPCGGSSEYMKIDPPADADKTSANNSCWLATASNMLAGAGYGNGSSLQARADDIYADMIAEFGTAAGGWTDAALDWWLGSPNNVWPTNPYQIVTVYGNKSPKYPWANPDGPEFFGNELRRCQYVGLSISWPTDAVDATGAPIIGSGGHAITCWGDDFSTTSSITINPAKVRVTDSDNDDGGDVQEYQYDTYTNPNPGGANEGDGWYFDYDPNHPYIKHIVTLCPVSSTTSNGRVSRATGSYRIHQNEKKDATDLHAILSCDTDILYYRLYVDWPGTSEPTVTETGNPPRKLEATWKFLKRAVPYCNYVTVTAEYLLPRWNAVKFDSVYFTYNDVGGKYHFGPFGWIVKSPSIDNATKIRNITGGYVVGAFTVVDPQAPLGDTAMEYRLVHEQAFDENPEMHELMLSGKAGTYVTNIRLGYSYGYPSGKELWGFKNWMTVMRDRVIRLSDSASVIEIDWKGRLPYPEGEDITGRIKDRQK